MARKLLFIAEYTTGGSVESLLCLVSGLNQTQYVSHVLFFSKPDEKLLARYQATGATVHWLTDHARTVNAPSDHAKRNLQGRVRRIAGQSGEKLYEAFKYALHFLRFRLSIYRGIRKKIEALQPDLVHLNNGLRSDTPGILAARRNNVPAVCHVRTFSKLTYLNTAAASKVQRFLCISNAVRDRIVEYGVAPERCVVVPNAVDLETFAAPKRSVEAFRADLGLASGKLVFTLAGRIVWWKGHEYFIEALAQARQQNDNIVGLIVGDAGKGHESNAFLERLKQQATELRLDDDLVFTGHRDDISDVMRISDVVVCPSSEPEPFGRVIIEGMATGAAVIGTNAGGAPDIIRDNVNGRLVPIKDSAALAAAMLDLAEDGDKRKALAKAGRDDVATRFTVERHARLVEAIYSQLS